MKRVLVSATNYSQYCSRGKAMLEEQGFVIDETKNNRPYTKEELLNIIGKYDAAVVGCDEWNEEVFSAAHKLRAIARFGIGVDNIDLEAAKAHGISVTNCVGINSNSVAEHAVTMILAMNRLLPRLNQTTREGKWERVIVHEMHTYTIGLLGFGGIARKVAEKLIPFHPNIIAFDKFPNKEEANRLGIKLCDMETLFKESDMISIHVPATPETLHLICDNTISKMKDGAYIINTARGTIVDESAVARALENGKLAGVASDVFEDDPVSLDNPLLNLDNFICTPHTAAESYENYDETGMHTAQAIIDVFTGNVPQNLLTK